MHFFSIWDLLLILAYFASVVWVGFRSTRKQKDSADDFLLAGRTLTLPMFIATLVSTWYGGILGVGEYSYRYGISNWLVFGVPYYFFALVFAILLARRIRKSERISIPDHLYHHYGKNTSLLGAMLTFFLISPAPYVLMLGVLVQWIFGGPLLASILISAGLTVCYLFFGGFRSDVYANVLEFILMFLGFAIILPFAYHQFGGLDFIRSHVPVLHLSWNGGQSLQFILVWFFIALWTLVDPSFYQRCLAARDGKTAQQGIFISILFWLFFDFMTSMTGLYARAILPGLSQPVYAYPLLAQKILPDFAKGLFFIGMLATIMSTLSSLSFISAVTVGHDFYARLRPPMDGAKIRRATQYGLFISMAYAVGMALLIPSVVRLWYTIGTTIIPGLIVPVLAGYFPKAFFSQPVRFFIHAMRIFDFNNLVNSWTNSRK